ncbi:MAG TPA: HAD-IIIA family hydrolase [Solirubrobacteraceae bacterium]|nr:HAD-IIIA family hydrolase [Solirubrobacteraceae bacterium]
MSTEQAVAFLDRDGVLNELVVDPRSGTRESPLMAREVRLIPGAAAAAARLAQAGFALVCVTNQPAAACGKASIERLLQVHAEVERLLAQAGVALSASRLCWHHPEGVVPELTMGCDCRKPAPGMLLDAARAVEADLGASWMVGDTDVDIQAGRAAGCRTLLLECQATADRRTDAARADLRAGDLAEGAERMLAYRSSETFH